jgi:hypothetical protein
LGTTYEASGLPRTETSGRSFNVDALASRVSGLSAGSAHAVKRGGKAVAASVTQIKSVSMMTCESRDHCSWC